MPDTDFAELRSDRLVLRRFQRADLPAFIAYRSDAVVARYQSWDTPYSSMEAERLLADLDAQHPDTPGQWFQFAVALAGTDALIGDCGLHVLVDEPRQVEIGYSFAPNYQGQGYAAEAVRRLLDYLFRERGKHRVAARCDDRNARSAALLDRVGLRREGHLIESTWAKGEWSNDLLFGVLRREWLAAP